MITQPIQVRNWETDEWVDLCSLQRHVDLLWEKVQ